MTMVTLYVASSSPYSGKTLTCIVLGTHWQRQGRRVGYLKPLGLLPVTVEGQVTDEDALFVAGQLGLEDPAARHCPVVLDPSTCHIDARDARQRVREAFTAAARDKDLMLVNGIGDVLTRGSMIGLGGVAVAEMLEAKVLLVTRCDSFLDADEIIAAGRALGERVVGVVLNRVPDRRRDEIEQLVIPCLESQGLTVLGMMPDDPILHSVSVQEIAEAVAGELLCGAEACDELVESFVVGAMGVESALRYFRNTPRKCVITGGDRSDIQLAALETPTQCLILTGGLRPSHTVIARAEQQNTPLLLAAEDTLTVVGIIEEMLGKLRVREQKKVDHALEQFERHVDLARLEALLGIA